MENRQPRLSAVVAAGILTASEDADLSGEEQAMVEPETQALIARHGEDLLRRDRDRLRCELLTVL